MEEAGYNVLEYVLGANRLKASTSSPLGHNSSPISFFLSSFVFRPSTLTSSISQRGNQRDRDRERAQARSGNKTKQPKADGLTPEQRRERDAKALQEKAAKKAAQAQAAGGNKAGGINAGGKK
ncbi:PREDICTED: uncharacterized protein LOC101306206 [Fragaria vesca subsp. vesca]